LTVNDIQMTIPRHIVIATRVNPNAVARYSRRLQVRAWNKADESTRVPVPREAMIDIVAAHLFGLFMNLRLRETARAIALSVQLRAVNQHPNLFARSVAAQDEAIHQSESELRLKMTGVPKQAGDASVILSIDTDHGNIEVAIAAPTINVVRQLCQAQTSDQFDSILADSDRLIARWVADRRKQSVQRGSIVLSVGAEITFPRDGWDQP
jgi:hypothetical protein